MGQKKRQSLIKLRCAVQNYSWGRLGDCSTVGRLYALQSGTQLEADKPYAELWMGTHQSGPSYVVLEEEAESNVIPLKDWLINNPKALGVKVLQRWGTDLPFLFKVLSVEKALSIQAHPDKHLAEKLHFLQPNIYKDANHKPEMALALTQFEALCGFVSPQELQDAVRSVPELQSILGESLSNALMSLSLGSPTGDVTKLPLRAAFTTIMTASKDVIAKALDQLLSRLVKEGQERPLTSKEKLVLRLADQYPSDVGVLAAFFFNYIQLNPGQALYLDANEPHAYLSGECLECMATSDNVVRAGLTPKYIDVNTLCAMLTYKQDHPEILHGVPVNMYTMRYLPPFEEFEMDCCVIPCGSSLKCSANLGPSIMIVISGSGEILDADGSDGGGIVQLQAGDTFFIPAGVELELNAKSKSDGPLHLYRAGVNTKMLVNDANGISNNHQT